MPCPKCCQRIEEGARHIPTMKEPSIKTLERWSFNGIAKATDGCKVEPDGKCPHGHESWLLVKGII